MAMQTVFDRADSLDALKTALAGFGPHVTQDLGKLLAPGLAPGQPLPDLDLTQQLIVQAAERPFETLRQAESALETAEDEEERLREKHQQQARALYDEFVDLRRIIRSVYGKREVEVFLGVKGETPRKAQSLLELADCAVRRLSHPKKKLPKPKTGVRFDPVPRVSALRRQARALRKTEKDLAMAESIASAAQTDRKNALEDFNEVFADAADVVAGLFRLAGHGQMARGFKPSRQHKGRTLVDVKRRQKRRARKRGREEEKVEAFAGAREEGLRNAEALDGVREAGGETPPAPTAAGDGDVPRSRPSRRPRAWLRFASRRRGRSFRDLPVSSFDSCAQNDFDTSQGLLHRVFLRLARPKGRL